MLRNVTKSDPMVLAAIVLLTGLITSLMLGESFAQTQHPANGLPDDDIATIKTISLPLFQIRLQESAAIPLQLNAVEASK